MKWAAILILAIGSTGARADVTKFYETEKIGKQWRVLGVVDQKTFQMPTCVMHKEWDDGSYLDISRDIEGDNFFIWLKNVNWEIDDPTDKRYTLRLNMRTSRKITLGKDVSYVLINKNTIDIPGIDGREFLRAFVMSTQMDIVMGGTISNARAGIERPDELLWQFGQCVTTWLELKKKIEADRKEKSNRESIPDALRQPGPQKM